MDRAASAIICCRLRGMRPRPQLLPGGARRGRPLNDSDFSTESGPSSSSDDSDVTAGDGDADDEDNE